MPDTLFTTDLIYSDNVAISECPTTAQFDNWFATSFKLVTHRHIKTSHYDISLKICDTLEMAQLNHHYRQNPSDIPKATNVLSFPADNSMLAGELHYQLGDIVFCKEVIEQEAITQQKSCLSHWAHMSIHGLLHLLGYDHEGNQEAFVMESLETQILAALDLPAPYATPYAHHSLTHSIDYEPNGHA